MNGPFEKSTRLDRRPSGKEPLSALGRLISRSSCYAVVLFAAPTSLLQAQSSVTVPGNTQITLAAQPNGRRSATGHVAPANLPVRYSGTLVPGRGLRFVASGRVDNSGPEGLAPAASGWYTTAEEFYRPATIVPKRALVGLFLQAANDPAGWLDFRGDLAEHSVVRPMLGQPFLIGTGRTSAGEPKTIVIPAKATMFYLAVAGDISSTGSYTVIVSDGAVPIPPGLAGPHRISGASTLNGVPQPYPGLSVPADSIVTMYESRPNQPSARDQSCLYVYR